MAAELKCVEYGHTAMAYSNHLPRSETENEPGSITTVLRPFFLDHQIPEQSPAWHPHNRSHTMPNRNFFFLSLAAVIGGVVLQLFSMSQTSAAVESVARSIELPAEQRTAARVEANQLLKRGETLQRVGMGCSMIGIVLMAVSIRRREPAKPSIIVGLLGIQTALTLIFV